MKEYTLGKKVLFVLADGRLVTLAAAEGHPSEVMSLSFCGQALAVQYLVDHGEKLASGVHSLPPEIDDMIARLHLNATGISIDRLTKSQKKYLSSWREGT